MNLLAITGTRILIAYACAYVGVVLGDYAYHWGTTYAVKHLSKLLDPSGPVVFCAMGLLTPTPLTFSVSAVAILVAIGYISFHKLPWWFCFSLVPLFAALTYVTLSAWRS